MKTHRLLRHLALACLWVSTGAAVAQPSPPPAAPLSVVVLGSGGPGATGRAASSYLVLVDGTPRIVVDAGPGSFVRLGEAHLPLARLDLVLLTHLHVDHAGELPGLLKARAVSSRGPIRFNVFGPAGRAAHGDSAAFPSTTRLMDRLFGPRGAFAYLSDFSAPMTLLSTDIATPVRRTRGAAPDSPRVVHAEGDLVVTAIPGHHRDAPAVIYRIDHAGQSITFSGDIDAEGLPGLARIAQGTGLLVFNSVVLDPPGSPQVLYGLHTPPRAIGELAAASRVGQLLLSHLSPAVEQARGAVEASITQAYAGPKVFAEDGMRIDLGAAR